MVQDLSVWHFSLSPTSGKPELGAYIASAITAWSQVEMQQVRLLAAMLGADAITAMEMYSSVPSADAQRKMLDAVAKRTLAAERYKEFNDLAKAITAARNRRNEFAHWFWFCSDLLPDALLLTDPKNIFGVQAGEIDILRGTASDFPIPDWDTVYVYRVKDLENSVNLCVDAARAMTWFVSIYLAEAHGDRAIISMDQAQVDERRRGLSKYLQSRLPHRKPST